MGGGAAQKKRFLKADECAGCLDEAVNNWETHCHSLGEISRCRISSTLPTCRPRALVLQKREGRDVCHSSNPRKPRSLVPLIISQTSSCIFSCDCNYKGCWSHQIGETRLSAHLWSVSASAPLNSTCQPSAEISSAPGRYAGALLCAIALIVIPTDVAMLEIKWSPLFALLLIVLLPNRKEEMVCQCIATAWPFLTRSTNESREKI